MPSWVPGPKVIICYNGVETRVDFFFFSATDCNCNYKYKTHQISKKQVSLGSVPVARYNQQVDIVRVISLSCFLCGLCALWSCVEWRDHQAQQPNIMSLLHPSIVGSLSIRNSHLASWHNRKFGKSNLALLGALSQGIHFPWWRVALATMMREWHCFAFWETWNLLANTG